MSAYQDHRIVTQGITLRVREYPHSTGAVLFLHFGGGNLMMWQRAVPAFQDSYRLILVDLRDHGKSDKPQSGDDIDQMARDLVGVLDYLKLEQVHVIGSSLGAEVGLSLAANFPDRVRSLVCDGALCSEYGPYGTWEGTEIEFREHVNDIIGKYHKSDQPFPSIRAFVDSRKDAFIRHGTWNDYFGAMMEYDAHPQEDGHFTRSWQHQARENYMQAYFDCRFEEYYRQVKCPVLMVTGDEETENPLEKSAILRMSELPADGRLIVVPGWEHPYGWLLDPDAMIRVVQEFLGDRAG
jgi:pimeloyl-ACP methyl ester carboxylesterase